MKRSPLTRKTPLRARKPPVKAAKDAEAILPKPKARAPRTKPRKPSERERIYGPDGFLAFVHSLRCVCCGHAGDIHAHHTENGGMGRKEDWTTIVPVCAAHHRMLHDCGAKRIGAMFGLDWTRAARLVQAAWEEKNEDTPKHL